MSAEEETPIDRLFDALGVRSRRAIIDLLAATPCSVSDLAEALGMTKTAIGQHIVVLEKSRMIVTEKKGRTRMCRIDPAGFALLSDWIASHRDHWQSSLDRLDAFMDRPEN